MPFTGSLPRTFALTATVSLLMGFNTIASPVGVAASENNISYGPNGSINAIIPDGAGGAYIGGDFTAWGYSTGGLASISSSTAAPDLTFPDVNGIVEAIEPDGAGGYFIGGLFDEVGGEERENLAHINAAGNVTDWAPETYGDNSDPDSDGMVFTLELHDDVVYTGGRFLEVWDEADGVDRPQPLAAAFDASTAQVLGWNPGFASNAGTGWFNLVNTAVWDFHVSGTTLFVSGSFDGVTSTSPATTRSGIAAFDLEKINDPAEDFGLTTWAPNPDGPILAMAASPVVGNLLIGGIFVHIGADMREHMSFAELNMDTAEPTLFDAPVTEIVASDPGQVQAITVTGTDIYIGGWFDKVDGQLRANLARVSSVGVVNPWDPAPDEGVEAIAISGTDLYVAGFFSDIDGQELEGVARFDSVGVIAAWDPGLDNSASALSPIAGGILIGGGFSVVDSISVRQLVRTTSSGAADESFDAVSSMEEDFYNEAVTALAIWTGELAVGRTGLERLNDNPGDTLEWLNPANGVATSRLSFVPNGAVTTLVAGSRLYVGGDFTSVDPPGGDPAVARPYGFAVLSDGESLASWAPGFAGPVNQLHDDGSFIYAVGEGLQTGSYIGGTPFAVRAARLEDGLIDGTWSVDFGAGSVYGEAFSITTWAGGVVIGGRMLTSTSAGDTGLSLLGASSVDGSITWQGAANGRSYVNAIVPRTNSLIVGGTGSLNTNDTFAPPFGLAILDLPTPPTTRTSWQPDSPYDISAVVISGSNLFVGGSSGLLITPAPVDNPNGGGGGGGGGGTPPATPSVTTTTAESTTSTQALGPDTSLTLRPGDVAIVSNGTRVPALGTPGVGNRSLIVTGGGVSLTVPSPTGLGGSGAPLWEPGQTAKLNTGGFNSASTTNAYLLSTPTLVGSSNANNTNEVAVTVPPTLRTGTHTLQVVGKDSQGRTLIVAVGLTVDKSPQSVGLTVDKSPQSVGTSVSFRLGSSQLTQSAKATLRSMNKQLSTHSKSDPVARVVGVTRERKTRPADIRLAKARANAVSQYMRSLGYEGTLRVSTSKATGTGDSTNRRVNVSVTWSR